MSTTSTPSAPAPQSAASANVPAIARAALDALNSAQEVPVAANLSVRSPPPIPVATARATLTSGGPTFAFGAPQPSVSGLSFGAAAPAFVFGSIAPVAKSTNVPAKPDAATQALLPGDVASLPSLSRRNLQDQEKKSATIVFCRVDGHSYVRTDLMAHLHRDATKASISKSNFKKFRLPSGAESSVFIISDPKQTSVDNMVAQMIACSCVDDWTASSGQTECALTLQPFEDPYFYEQNGRAYSYASLEEAFQRTMMKGDPLNLDIGITLMPEHPHTGFVQYRGVWKSAYDVKKDEMNKDGAANLKTDAKEKESPKKEETLTKKASPMKGIIPAKKEKEKEKEVRRPAAKTAKPTTLVKDGKESLKKEKAQKPTVPVTGAKTQSPKKEASSTKDSKEEKESPKKEKKGTDEKKLGSSSESDDIDDGSDADSNEDSKAPLSRRYVSPKLVNHLTPRVLVWNNKVAAYPLCKFEVAQRRNIPNFSIWLHNVRDSGSIWDSHQLWDRYCVARSIVGSERKPEDEILIVQDMVVEGARLFSKHPKMDQGKFIFRNVVFNACLITEDCFCGVSFYSCAFVNCIFVMPNWARNHSRLCVRRCTYTSPILLSRPDRPGATRADFLGALGADPVVNGDARVCSNLLEAMRRLPANTPTLYTADAALSGWM